MAKRILTCKYCGEKFDANDKNVEFVAVTARRYAHKKCAEDFEKSKTQNQKDEDKFFKYVQYILSDDYNYLLTKKLAEKYIKENGYTYSGMLKSLYWFYEIKHNSTDKANGSIGIIPYIYNEAKEYFYALYLAKLANKEKNVEEYIKPDVIYYEVPSPRANIKAPKLFDLGGD